MSEQFLRLLQEGIAAAKAGDKAQARRLLIEATEANERSEQAWLWLSGVVDDPQEVRICLENVLAINPANERARQGLAWLQSRAAAPPAAAPAPPPPPPSRPAPPPIEEQIAEAPLPLPPEDLEGKAEEEMESPGNRIPCPACGAMNYDFADKCVKCGFPLTIQCTKCGETVPTETGLCPRCGADLPLPRTLGAVREREDKVEEMFRQGLTALAEQRYQEAKELLEEVLLVHNDHIEARYNLGAVCAAMGLREEARQHWEQVQQMNPEYPGIQKELDSLLSPQDRRRMMSRDRKKGEPRPKKEREEEQRRASAGQSLMWEYEQKKEEEKPVPEEEMGGFEAFLYVLMVGLVIGVAYALNQPSGIAGLTTDRIVIILKQTGVIVLVLFLFWIVQGILCRLLSLIFKGKGKMGGYMASSVRFLMPFFLLIFPIVLNIPQIVKLLPETVRPWLQQFPKGSGLERLPPPPWLIFGGLALFLGLFALVRGVGRVGRMALWKGFLVALVALVITVAAVGGLAYLGYTTADSMGYLDALGLGPTTVTPMPTVAPGTPTAVPTAAPTP